MSGPLLIDRAGSGYYVTARGNERRDIYRDDADRMKFLALLEEQSGRFWIRGNRGTDYELKRVAKFR